MASVPITQSSTAASRRQIGWIVIIGLVSGMLYALVYWAQRGLYLNGLYANIGGVFLFGVPRDRARLFFDAGVYLSATIGLFLLYAWLLRRCEHQLVATPWSRRLALGFPVLFNLVFLLGRPLLSIDIFSYIAHGYLGTTPGFNPYQDAVRDVINTSFGRGLVLFGWRPVHGVSPYGPLWTQVEILVFQLSQDVPTVLLMLKAVIVAASLGSAAIIWKILGHVRPKDQLLGTLAYLWNPMIVVEFASEGHNDALMIVFVLLGLYLAVRMWRSFAIASLLMGVLSKFIPLILLPAQIIYLWKRRQNWMHFALRVILGLGLGIGIAALLYQPVWIGMDTFQGVREQGRPSFYASTLVPLLVFLQRTREETAAAQLSLLILGGIFALFTLVTSLRVHDDDSLLRACASIALAYLLLASPTYWPWYAALPLALMALTPHGVFRWMIFVLTFCSRVVAPIDDIAVNGFLDSVFRYRHPAGAWGIEVWSTTIIALLIPLAFVLGLCAWQIIADARRSRRRPTATDVSS